MEDSRSDAGLQSTQNNGETHSDNEEKPSENTQEEKNTSRDTSSPGKIFIAGLARETTTGELEGGPCTRLRPRTSKPKMEVTNKGADKALKQPISSKSISKGKKKVAKAVPSKNVEEKNMYLCDTEGCTMSFPSKHDLQLHKRNICTFKGCGKHFFSHKYLVQHCRVHLDERPLSCPWKGCKMTFKWAWARTEHIRVHTGERPYVCTTAGCGQSFRFVSDFSRHKRKTGHSQKN